jgi:hypothetical protein
VSGFVSFISTAMTDTWDGSPVRNRDILQDRLVVAQAMGSSEEILTWLSAWISTCCKVRDAGPGKGKSLQALIYFAFSYCSESIPFRAIPNANKITCILSTFPAQYGLTGRLQWLTRRLIELHVSSLRESSRQPAGPDTATAVSGTAATSALLRSHSCWEWLRRLPRPLHLLQTVIMPVIAQNPSSHALLAEIDHTLALLGQG